MLVQGHGETLEQKQNTTRLKVQAGQEESVQKHRSNSTVTYRIRQKLQTAR